MPEQNDVNTTDPEYDDPNAPDGQVSDDPNQDVPENVVEEPLDQDEPDQAPPDDSSDDQSAVDDTAPPGQVVNDPRFDQLQGQMVHLQNMIGQLATVNQRAPGPPAAQSAPAQPTMPNWDEMTQAELAAAMGNAFTQAQQQQRQSLLKEVGDSMNGYGTQVMEAIRISKSDDADGTALNAALNYQRHNPGMGLSAAHTAVKGAALQKENADLKKQLQGRKQSDQKHANRARSTSQRPRPTRRQQTPPSIKGEDARAMVKNAVAAVADDVKQGRFQASQ